MLPSATRRVKECPAATSRWASVRCRVPGAACLGSIVECRLWGVVRRPVRFSAGNGSVVRSGRRLRWRRGRLSDADFIIALATLVIKEV
jgi:hypothetical protein